MPRLPGSQVEGAYQWQRPVRGESRSLRIVVEQREGVSVACEGHILTREVPEDFELLELRYSEAKFVTAVGLIDATKERRII